MPTHLSSSAGSTMSPTPCHPAFLYDLDLTAPSPSPSPPPPPPQNNNHHLRPASARRRPSSRRRPRPSRKKVPPTYFAADPASFRRMVHQVTGADDLLHLPLPPLAPKKHEATTALCRPAPSRAAAAGALTRLPTLDTSALLLGSWSARRTTTTGLAASVPPAAAWEVDVAAGVGVGVRAGLGGAGYSSSDSGGGGGRGFPTLESWDDALSYY
ncbi:protein piccolo-like [Sorghum bicolor]|uniref:protein piccolo-like n=1 Tax=Sorghum bicolor TaxID=4558 RepID=UPI000B425105|nr:protein piccolo-like [Sorghum bicolor]|eukprot:XP_021317050.1 protein piccolo-like [Sorghum bicolor]